MKTLVVFSSRTGNTRMIAQELAIALDADIEEIEEKKGRNGLVGYLRAGRDSMKKRTGDIKPTAKDPGNYELVVIGTPIWAWTMCVPIRTYISLKKDKFRKVAFFCTCDGNRKQTFEEMETECGKKSAASLEILSKELKTGNYRDKLKGFVDKIKA